MLHTEIDCYTYFFGSCAQIQQPRAVQAGVSKQKGTARAKKKMSSCLYIKLLSTHSSSCLVRSAAHSPPPCFSAQFSSLNSQTCHSLIMIIFQQQSNSHMGAFSVFWQQIFYWLINMFFFSSLGNGLIHCQWSEKRWNDILSGVSFSIFVILCT